MRRAVGTFLIVLLIMLLAADWQFIKNMESDPEPVRIINFRSEKLAQHQKVDSIHIRNNADFELVGATGSGTPLEPYILENLEINSSRTCILVEDTTAHFSISNCILESYDGWFAVQFINVVNGRVVGCDCRRFGGITIADSADITIEDTTVCGSSIGIYLNRVENSSIRGCTMFYNYWGIQLVRTNNSQMQENTIYGNWHNGFTIDDSSSNNTVYGNFIGWNNAANLEWSNAIDNGYNNIFDDGISIGNSWSDYDGSGAYVISGIGNSLDSFPQLFEDNVPPSITHSADTIIDIDSVGNILTWVTHDEYPHAYRIREDDRDLPMTPWIGGNVTFSLDRLEQGPHEINITLYDGAGNEAADGVLILVLYSYLGGFGTELVMFASGITLTIFIAIIILIRKLS